MINNPYGYLGMMNPYYNPTVSTHASHQSTLPPYDRKNHATHQMNPFHGQPYPLMPFYDPLYHGFSPFNSFTHFNPFIMPGFWNASMAMNSMMPYMNAQHMNHGNKQNPDIRKLSKDDQQNLNLHGDLPKHLQKKMNIAEAVSQEELNQQLAYLNGVTKNEYDSYKKLVNDAFTKHI